MKSINVEGGFFLWRVEFFKIGKRDVTFIREMRVPLTYSPLIASLGKRQFSWKGWASHWNWNEANVYLFIILSLIAYIFFFATNLVPLYLWFLCHQGILLIQLYLNLLGDLQCTWNQHFEQVLLVYWWLKSCEYVCRKNFILKKGKVYVSYQVILELETYDHTMSNGNFKLSVA